MQQSKINLQSALKQSEVGKKVQIGWKEMNTVDIQL